MLMDSPLQISSTMHASHTERIDPVIRELCQFSNLSMFGHLFDIHPMQLEILRTAETQCGIILNAQLRRDLPSAGEMRPADELTMARIRLEEKLAVLFNSSAPFWEQYYIRQSAHPGDRYEIRDSSALSVRSVARTHYPAFYFMLDALHFGSGERSKEYPLIQMSLQSYLTACLLACSDKGHSALESFTEALHILGPINAPEYRKILVEAIRR